MEGMSGLHDVMRTIVGTYYAVGSGPDGATGMSEHELGQFTKLQRFVLALVSNLPDILVSLAAAESDEVAPPAVRDVADPTFREMDEVLQRVAIQWKGGELDEFVDAGWVSAACSVLAAFKHENTVPDTPVLRPADLPPRNGRMSPAAPNAEMLESVLGQPARRRRRLVPLSNSDDDSDSE